VRGGVPGNDLGLQRLPCRHGASLSGHQGARRRLELSGSGIPALGTIARPNSRLLQPVGINSNERAAILLPPAPVKTGATKGFTMTKRPTSLERRTLMRGVIAGIAAGLTRPSVRPASARDKMSKQEAEYQDSPKDIRMCATCTLYEPPSSCKVVEG